MVDQVATRKTHPRGKAASYMHVTHVGVFLIGEHAGAVALDPGKRMQSDCAVYARR